MLAKQRNDSYTKSQYNKHLPALPPSPTRGHQSEAQYRPKPFDTGTDSSHHGLSISHPRSTATLPAGLHDASEYISRSESRRIDFPEGSPVTNGSKGRTTVKADVPVPTIGLFLRPPTSQFDATEIALQSPTAVESYEFAFSALRSGPRPEWLGSNRCKHSIRRLDIQKRIINDNSSMGEVGITPPDRWQEVTDQTVRLKRRRRVMKRESISEADYDNQATLSSPQGHPPASFAAPNVTLPNPESSPRPKRKHPHKKKKRYCVYDEPGTIHTLPLLLSASQDYECLVQWEEEEGTELDRAEMLWRDLEREFSPVPSGAECLNRSQRGRWKVKVVKTPVIQYSEPEQDDSIGTEPNLWKGEAYTDACTSPFRGTPVLCEVDGLLPSVGKYRRLSAAINRKPVLGDAPIRRSSSHRVIHSEVKRALEGMWEDLMPEAGTWACEMALFRSRSLSFSNIRHCSSSMKGKRSRKGTPLRRSSLSSGVRRSQSCPYHGDSISGDPEEVGLGIAMCRTTGASMAADSLIDYYLD